jgi:hypothetical protein
MFLELFKHSGTDKIQSVDRIAESHNSSVMLATSVDPDELLRGAELGDDPYFNTPQENEEESGPRTLKRKMAVRFRFFFEITSIWLVDVWFCSDVHMPQMWQCTKRPYVPRETAFSKESILHKYRNSNRPGLHKAHEACWYPDRSWFMWARWTGGRSNAKLGTQTIVTLVFSFFLREREQRAVCTCTWPPLPLLSQLSVCSF